MTINQSINREILWRIATAKKINKTTIGHWLIGSCSGSAGPREEAYQGPTWKYQVALAPPPPPSSQYWTVGSLLRHIQLFLHPLNVHSLQVDVDLSTLVIRCKYLCLLSLSLSVILSPSLSLSLTLKHTPQAAHTCEQSPQGRLRPDYRKCLRCLPTGSHGTPPTNRGSSTPSAGPGSRSQTLSDPGKRHPTRPVGVKPAG